MRFSTHPWVLNAARCILQVLANGSNASSDFQYPPWVLNAARCVLKFLRTAAMLRAMFSTHPGY